MIHSGILDTLDAVADTIAGATPIRTVTPDEVHDWCIALDRIDAARKALADTAAEIKEWVHSTVALEPRHQLEINGYGIVKARRQQPSVVYEREELLQAVWTRVQDDESLRVDGHGEPVEFAQAFGLQVSRCFRVEPRLTALREIDIDPDEFVKSVSGSAKETIQISRT